MANYDKEKDLARILVEGTKAVYGAEKAKQVKTEFAGLQQQTPYRRNAEELTSVVDRICGEPEVLEAEVVEAVAAESIDDLVESYGSKPSMLKVAAKGTLNLMKKMHVQDWYYPLVGALPGRYQQRIAEKYGDNSHNYTIANAITEGVIVTGLLGSLINVPVGLLFGFGCGMVNTLIRSMVVNENSNKHGAGSIVTCIPFYITLYSIVAAKAINKGIVDAYSSALQEEKQRHKPKRIKPNNISQESTPAINEEQEPEIFEEEFEEENIEQKVKKL